MARRTFRRRGSRGIWLPVADQYLGGTVEVTGTTFDEWTMDAAGFIEGNVPVNTDGDEASGIVSQTPAGLAFLNGTGFTVKRIVGSVFVDAVQSGSSACLVADCFAGIFVDRVKQDGTLETLENWNPGRTSAGRKRWLWQRHWLLNNNQTGPYPSEAAVNYPTTNVAYGDVMSGPHIDARTKARVGPQEMLFFMCAVRILYTTVPEATTSQVVNFNPRLRVFSSRVYAAGNRE